MCCNWYTFIENNFRWIIFSVNMSSTNERQSLFLPAKDLKVVCKGIASCLPTQWSGRRRPSSAGCSRRWRGRAQSPGWRWSRRRGCRSWTRPSSRPPSAARRSPASTRSVRPVELKRKKNLLNAFLTKSELGLHFLCHPWSSLFCRRWNTRIGPPS